MVLKQAFRVNDIVAEFSDPINQGYSDVRLYLFSVFRMRALENLLETRPTGPQVMAFMANAAPIWTEFHSTPMALTISDALDMISAFEHARLSECEDVLELIREYVKDPSVGVLVYSVST